jgi:hypothetical protein
MPATKYSRHQTANFVSQYLHDDYLSNLPSYPSTINAQWRTELGHPALPQAVLFGLY